jgi:hypothetical protein
MRPRPGGAGRISARRADWPRRSRRHPSPARARRRSGRRPRRICSAPGKCRARGSRSGPGLMAAAGRPPDEVAGRAAAVIVGKRAFDHVALLAKRMLVIGQPGAGRHPDQRGHGSGRLVDEQRLGLDPREPGLLPGQLRDVDEARGGRPEAGMIFRIRRDRGHGGSPRVRRSSRACSRLAPAAAPTIVARLRDACQYEPHVLPDRSHPLQCLTEPLNPAAPARVTAPEAQARRRPCHGPTSPTRPWAGSAANRSEPRQTGRSRRRETPAGGVVWPEERGDGTIRSGSTSSGIAVVSGISRASACRA